MRAVHRTRSRGQASFEVDPGEQLKIARSDARVLGSCPQTFLKVVTEITRPRHSERLQDEHN